VSDFFGEQHGLIGISASCSCLVKKVATKCSPQRGRELARAVFRSGDLSASAVRVFHGAVPALAWRVEIGGKVIVFSGDTNGEDEGLVRLAMNADLFMRTTPCRKEPSESRGDCTCRRR